MTRKKLRPDHPLEPEELEPEEISMIEILEDGGAPLVFEEPPTSYEEFDQKARTGAFSPWFETGLVIAVIVLMVVVVPWVMGGV